MRSKIILGAKHVAILRALLQNEKNATHLSSLIIVYVCCNIFAIINILYRM